MAKQTEFEKYTAKSQAALALLDSETADEIIGSPPPEEYDILIQGVDGTFKMLWAMARGNGLRITPKTTKMGGQALMVLSTLVHYAFALGVRYGRGESE